MGRKQIIDKDLNPPTESSPRTSGSRLRTGLLLALCAAAAVALAGWRLHIGRAIDTASAGSPSTGSAFGPTVPNPGKPSIPAPAGMIWIPGGEFSMGAGDPPGMDEVGMNATKDSRPIHRVYVDGFFMDKTDVTNAQFARFVKATGYVTVAERKPRQDDYPNAPPENLVAGSVVFSAPDHPVPLNDHF
ncbi:MAG: SUMF1/EgtB/PvdO family nonheme iron enzyme, partial [Candidatus Korobacteraceae bacterium]